MSQRSILVFLMALPASVLGLLSGEGGIPVAEGCSGSAPGPIACATPGWESASWTENPENIPTDGVVLLTLKAAYSCDGEVGAGGSKVSAVQIEVEGPDGTLIPGSPSSIDGPAIYSQTLTENKVFVWRSEAPLLPLTTYSLRVLGLVGAASTPTSLPFTTGPGPFQLPRPVLEEPRISTRQRQSGKELCCVHPPSLGSCSSVDKKNCAQQRIDQVPYFSATARVDVATKTEQSLFSRQIQLSIDDGPFSSIDAGQELEAGQHKVCARALATNLVTMEETFSDIWCGSLDGLDLKSKPNCEKLLEIYSSCGVEQGQGAPSGVGHGAPRLESSDGDPTTLYGETCSEGNSGGAGCRCGLPGTIGREGPVWPGMVALLAVASLRRRRR